MRAAAAVYDYEFIEIVVMLALLILAAVHDMAFAAILQDSLFCGNQRCHVFFVRSVKLIFVRNIILAPNMSMLKNTSVLHKNQEKRFKNKGFGTNIKV